MVTRLAMDYSRAIHATNNVVQCLKIQKELMIRWNPPPKGWFSLNADGLVFQHIGFADCEGIVRDYRGTFVAGFMANLGNISITMVELWAVYIGLKSSFNLGIKNMITQIDSFCIVSC